jgi:xanthine/CO dehydrogenase XdhC/CoxF family maturation factor
MRTLDSAWKQFIQNAGASYRITTTKTETAVQRQLAMQLGLVEAAMVHLDVKGMSFDAPLVYSTLVELIRKNIWTGSTLEDFHSLSDCTDEMFRCVVRMEMQGIHGFVASSVLSGAGWLARSVLFLAANMTDRANESGRNTLDAITRVLVLTGHMQKDLVALMQTLSS